MLSYLCCLVVRYQLEVAGLASIANVSDLLTSQTAFAPGKAPGGSGDFRSWRLVVGTFEESVEIPVEDETRAGVNGSLVGSSLLCVLSPAALS